MKLRTILFVIVFLLIFILLFYDISAEEQTLSIQQPTSEIFITGPFTLRQYQPYFVGAKRNAIITWAGKLPQRQVFELKHVTEYLGKPKDSENFIVLPFDTKIKMASQLCDIRDKDGNQIIDQNQYLGWWDSLTQEVKYSTERCNEIRFNDFDVNPGQVYKIFVQRDANWKQI